MKDAFEHDVGAELEAPHARPESGAQIADFG
jgi:hypothetical protein